MEYKIVVENIEYSFSTDQMIEQIQNDIDIIGVKTESEINGTETLVSLNFAVALRLAIKEILSTVKEIQ